MSELRVGERDALNGYGEQSTRLVHMSPLYGPCQGPLMELFDTHSVGDTPKVAVEHVPVSRWANQ